MNAIDNLSTRPTRSCKQSPLLLPLIIMQWQKKQLLNTLTSHAASIEQLCSTTVAIEHPANTPAPLLSTPFPFPLHATSENIRQPQAVLACISYASCKAFWVPVRAKYSGVISPLFRRKALFPHTIFLDR